MSPKEIFGREKTPLLVLNITMNTCWKQALEDKWGSMQKICSDLLVLRPLMFTFTILCTVFTFIVFCRAQNVSNTNNFYKIEMAVLIKQLL